MGKKKMESVDIELVPEEKLLLAIFRRPEPGPREQAQHSEMSDLILRAIEGLTYREREIVKLRYGLGDGYYYDLEECGKIFRVTRERVRQVEAKAINKLRALLFPALK